MKKFFSLIAAVLFAGSMMAAVGNLYYTFATAQSGSNTAYATNYDVTIDGMDWSVPGNQNFSGYLGIGGKSLNGVDRVISSKTPMGDAIAKIKISHNGTSSDNLIVNSITIVAASNAAFTTDVVEQELTPTISKQVAGAVEFVAENGSWANNSYYQIKINLTNAKNSNYRFDITKIEFYSYQDDSAPAITAEKIDLGLVASTVLPVVQNAELAVTGANLTEAIAYSVIGDNVTVTGSLTAAGGTLNVALSANAEGEISDTIVLTSGATVAKVPVEAKIVKTDGDGSKENPFSVADVVKLNNGYGMEKYWVMGYIVGCAANGGTVSPDVTNSNIAIGDAADQNEDVVPVELPSGDIRSALNLSDNSGNMGKLVKVHGQLISYFAWSGVKATDDYVIVEPLADGYYLNGSFCGWNASADYMFEQNPAKPEEYMLSGIELAAGDAIKVIGKAGETWTWYPGGETPNYDITEAGKYDIYFRPDGQGGDDWFYHYFYVAASQGSAIHNAAAEIKAIKRIENGQLVIIKNGVRYDATGTILK